MFFEGMRGNILHIFQANKDTDLSDFCQTLVSQQNTLLNDYPAKMSLVLFDRFGGGFSAIL
jgi:hypothetical protein